MDNFTTQSIEFVSPVTQSDEQEFISTFIVEKIYKIVITVIGLIGNGVTIIILTNKRNRRSSTSIYLTALAVSDIVILIFGPFCDWIEVMFKVIIREHGTFACKLQTFMHYSSSSTSSWLLAAVTIEKAVSVKFPYWVRSSCTTRITFIVIIVTWVILYAVNVHFLLGMGHTYNNVCAWVSIKYQNFGMYALPWIDFCLCFAIPFIFISIGNYIIIRQLAVSRAQRKHLTKSKVTRHLSVSLILVLVNVVFTLTVGPIYIFSIIDPYLFKHLNAEELAHLKGFWGPMLNGLWEMNAAVNMVLYILSGSKFRREVIYLICCKKPNRETGVFDNGVLMSRIYTLGVRRQQFLQQNDSNSCIEMQDLRYSNDGLRTYDARLKG